MTSKQFRMPKRLPFTIGFEFTGIPRDWKPGGEYKFDNWHPILWAVRDELFNKRTDTGAKGAHWDDSIEVTTLPTRSLRKIKRAYTATRQAFSACGVYPKHPDSVCGGGHIHIGSIDSAIKYNMFIDMLRRPYLPWAFSEPDEMDACDYPFASIHKFIKPPKQEPCHKTTSWPRPMPSYNGWYKSFMFRLDSAYDTCEFRFFEAPLNWEEQLLHIRFVVAYYQWIKNKPVKAFYPKDGYTRSQLRRISYKQARRMFRRFLVQLKLDPSDYEHFVQRNMRPRWQDGRIRR